jgi:ligand-binding sensor domain-containing protein
LQDRQGFIWVGTQGGLNRYDGYSFVQFDRETDNPASLRDNFINCLLEDRSGAIWAGTRQGLSRLDRASGKFSNYFFPVSEKEHLLLNHILSMHEDPQGNLWVATTGGLVSFDVAKKTLRQTILKTNSSTQPRINALATDGKGSMWLGAENGVIHFDQATNQ